MIYNLVYVDAGFIFLKFLFTFTYIGVCNKILKVKLDLFPVTIHTCELATAQSTGTQACGHEGSKRARRGNSPSWAQTSPRAGLDRSKAASALAQMSPRPPWFGKNNIKISYFK